MVGSVVGSAFGEEVVGSAVGGNDLGYKVRCIVDAEVVGDADGEEGIVSLVGVFVSLGCVGLSI